MLPEEAFSSVLVCGLYIPEGVTKIPYRACSNNRSLNLARLPESVTSIDDYAFYACSNLKIGTFPSCLTNIGQYAFNDCSNLDAVVIPATVENIGSYAFCNAFTSGAEITFLDTPKTIGEHAFDHIVSERVSIINVPWSEGEVAGAPWGATNATINYNHVAEEV
jgi:hypothetical protein